MSQCSVLLIFLVSSEPSVRPLRGLFDNESVECTRDPPWRDGQTEGQVDPVLLPAHLLRQLD